MKLRNLVVLKIKNQRDELHDQLEINFKLTEVFIPDDRSTMFPVYDPADALSLYNKMEIGDAIIAKDSALNCTK